MPPALAPVQAAAAYRATQAPGGSQGIGTEGGTFGATLQRAMGPATGRHLHQLAWGEDRRTVTPRRGEGEEPDKSIGADETFEYDIDDPREIHKHLLRLSV